MKAKQIALSFLVGSTFLFTQTTLASGGWRAPRATQPTVKQVPQPVKTIAKPILQKKESPTDLLDKQILQKLKEQGSELPSSWSSWNQAKKESFLASLDFKNQHPVSLLHKKTGKKIIRAKNYKPFTGKKRTLKTFTDTNTINNKAAVSELYQRGILDGYDNGAFKPSWPINRAESLKVLLEALGADVSSSEGKSSFSDVPKNAWFAKYVQKGKEDGIIKGNPDGTFRPGNTVNQAELLKISLEGFGIDLTSYETNNLPSGIDPKDWFAKYFQYAIDHTIISTSDIHPGKGMSREQFAGIVYNLIQQQEHLLSSTTPVIENDREEEKLSADVLAAYEAEQKIAQKAQIARQAQIKADVLKNTVKTIATGSIQAASGKTSNGSVTVEEKGDTVLITLSENFSISNGPDLYIALSQNQSFTGNGTVKLDPSKIKIIEALASTKGKQVYTISKDEYEKYKHGLTIWCKQYNVLFGAATFQ